MHQAPGDYATVHPHGAQQCQSDSRGVRNLEMAARASEKMLPSSSLVLSLSRHSGLPGYHGVPRLVPSGDCSKLNPVAHIGLFHLWVATNSCGSAIKAQNIIVNSYSSSPLGTYASCSVCSCGRPPGSATGLTWRLVSSSVPWELDGNSGLENRLQPLRMSRIVLYHPSPRLGTAPPLRESTVTAHSGDAVILE